MAYKKILITGAAGNIGSALVHRLIRNENFYVIGLDNLYTGNIKNLPKSNCKNFKFFNCNVNNIEEINLINEFNSFDYIFHYAAVVGVLRTLNNPMKVLKDIEGFKNIFNLAKNIGVKRVFFSSSSEIYGESFTFPQQEEKTPLNSKLPYAIVKNLGESFLRVYQKEYNLDYTIFRFFNTYGPNQTPDFVIPKFIKSAINNEDIIINGNGQQTRTFCFIDDNIDTTVKIMKDNLHINDVVNIGSDKEYTITELAEIILRITKSESKIVYHPALKEGDMIRRKPDITKMKGILQRDLVSIEDGIKKILDHMLKNSCKDIQKSFSSNY